MATTFQKTVKQVMNTTRDVFPDKLVCKKDGTVEVKKSFFYRFNRSAADLAAEVSAALTAAGVSHQVASTEEYRDWPGTSYFVAIVREKGN